MRSQFWARYAEPRVLDWLGLAALSDVILPRIFLLQPSPSPVSTLSMSIYLHATAEELSAVREDWVLFDVGAHAARHGFFDHYASLWARDGKLLASTTQLAWFA